WIGWVEWGGRGAVAEGGDEGVGRRAGVPLGWRSPLQSRGGRYAGTDRSPRHCRGPSSSKLATQRNKVNCRQTWAAVQARSSPKRYQSYPIDIGYDPCLIFAAFVVNCGLKRRGKSTGQP